MKMIESGLLRVFRYFTGIAMLYFAILVLYGQFELFYGITNETIAIQAYLNFLTYITLFGYLSLSWFRKKLGKFYLPIAIGYATAIPIFSNLIYLVSPDTVDFTLMISRSWMLFPILLIPMVITAWQYPFRYSFLYIVLVALVELSVLFSFINKVNLNTLPILGVPIIQGFAFGIVANIINQIVHEQRFQKQKLIEANVALSEYADTLEKLAITRERNRLARELHDTLAHTLSGLSVNLEAIKIMLNQNQDEIKTMIDHALDNTRVGLIETRRALRDLRPQTLVDLGLKDAANRGDFALKIKMADQLPNFSTSTGQAIYRIVQETFQNIVLHSNTERVVFETQWDPDHFHIIITDDGKGFHTEKIKHSEKFGINGMQERAKISGGNLKVTSTLGEGTNIKLTYEVRND
jgi:signal transduction histidine kinase